MDDETKLLIIVTAMISVSRDITAAVFNAAGHVPPLGNTWTIVLDEAEAIISNAKERAKERADERRREFGDEVTKSYRGKS